VTIKERIKVELSTKPYQTATALARRLDLTPGSVASAIHQLWKDNQIIREKTETFHGPRGGFLYSLPFHGKLVGQ